MGESKARTTAGTMFKRGVAPLLKNAFNLLILRCLNLVYDEQK